MHCYYSVITPYYQLVSYILRKVISVFTLLILYYVQV